MNTIIVAKNVSKVYKASGKPLDRLKYMFKSSNTHVDYLTDFWALRDISFSIKQGESVGIIGCNGSGKSTLLQLIAAILKPTHGSIDVTGRVAALLELGSGFNPEFTGKENVYFNAAILGLSKQEINANYEDIIAFADIGEFINKPVRTYSSGMMIRLAFAVMVHVSPDILIIDEALTVGDIFFQQKCIRLIKEKFAHKTKIFVAHDMSLISSLCHRVIYLDKGVLKFDGEVALGIEHYIKASQSQNNNSSLITHANKPGLDWDPVENSSLSGMLDVKITGVRILINNTMVHPPLAPVRYRDSIDIHMLVYSGKRNIKAIFGYLVCDKLGNYVFGQNHYNKTFHLLHEPGYYIAHYTFYWPDVAQGQYTLTPGIGEGEDPKTHTIQCWAHGVLGFDCISPQPVHGTFNNPLTYFIVNPQEESALGN